MSQLSFGFDSLKDHELFKDLKPSKVEEFFRFHSENPHVFELIEKFSSTLIDSGRARYGMRAVIERVRWHVNVETVGDEFKINNNHAAGYARLLIIKRPEFATFFSLRRASCERRSR